MIVKGMLAGLQTFLLFFSTVVWGVYDSFFRPMD